MMSEKRKGCPNCNSLKTDTLVMWNEDIAARCTQCGLQGPPGKTERKAMEYWNDLPRREEEEKEEEKDRGDANQDPFSSTLDAMKELQRELRSEMSGKADKQFREMVELHVRLIDEVRLQTLCIVASMPETNRVGIHTLKDSAVLECAGTFIAKGEGLLEERKEDAQKEEKQD